MQAPPPSQAIQLVHHSDVLAVALVWAHQHGYYNLNASLELCPVKYLDQHLADITFPDWFQVTPNGAFPLQYGPCAFYPPLFIPFFRVLC